MSLFGGKATVPPSAGLVKRNNRRTSGDVRGALLRFSSRSPPSEDVDYVEPRVPVSGRSEDMYASRACSR
jgi:hypothetical protein